MGLGLGRIQQRFNVAVAKIASFMRPGTFAEKQQHYAQTQTGGHPLWAKYLRSSNPAEVRSGYVPHQGARERARRLRQGAPR